MGRVLEKYKDFFRPAKVDGEDQAEITRDIQKFVSTDAFKTLRSRLGNRASEVRWTQGMTQEIASSNLIAQTIYLEIIEEMDKLVRESMESVDV